MKQFLGMAILIGAAAAAGAVDLIREGDALQPGGYHLVVAESDGTLTVADLGLREAGLARSAFFPRADEIRIFADASDLETAPLARIWIDEASGAYRFHTGGEGVADGYVIPKGAAVVVYLRASTAPVPWPKRGAAAEANP